MDAKKNPKAQHRILSALYLQPLYGSQIVKFLRERAPEVLKRGEGGVYPRLRRFEDQKLVRGEWRANPKGKRRRYYSLTKKGRRKVEKVA